MQEHLDFTKDKFTKPVRLLVNRMCVKDNFLSTKLIKYYMDHGLIISDVKEVVIFCISKPFKSFVDLVSKKRKQQRADPRTKILADMYKILLSALHGSFLMRCDKHQRITIVKDDYQASLSVNYKTFKALHPLGNGFYQIESVPDKVVFDLPMVLQFQILQLAKIKLNY